jgi:hypothetical protein
MATLKTPAPVVSSDGISSGVIADAGSSLVRLGVAAFTLPITAMSAIGTSLARLINQTTAAINGAPINGQGANELVKTASDLVGATANLYVSFLKAAINGLDGAAKAINAAATEVNKK